MGLKLKPITLKVAKEFIEEHHRHHRPPAGWKFGTSVTDEGKMVGVVVAGRPVARCFDDGGTLEVTRCCTDGTENACSMLYNAIRRAAKALGYSRVITYVLESERGTSLKAAGWRVAGKTKGGSWNCKSRPRKDKHPLESKVRWEAPL